MKVLGNLPIVKTNDANIPFGGRIQNETASQPGTPVVDDVLQDIFSNLYKLLTLTGITPTNGFDNELTQYQIVQALQKLPNATNDIEQVLSLDGSVWSVPLNIDIVPNKYFFIARAEEQYVGGTSYTFKGTSATSYSFTSDGFEASDQLIVIIDTSGVRAYSLFAGRAQDVFTVMGSPVSYNNGNKMYYQFEGRLLSDDPSSVDLESVIHDDYGNTEIVLTQMIYVSGYILCLCFRPTGNIYFFVQFAINDLSVSVPVNIIGASFGTSSDFAPYIYAIDNFVYVTNGMNSTANDYSTRKLLFSGSGSSLTSVSTLSIDASFVKTTSAAIKGNFLYTLVLGVLKKFDLTSGAATTVGTYQNGVGQLFYYNGYIYFTSGEVARKWF